MTDFLLYLLLVELALMILWGLWKPSRVYQYPFLAGCVFALWAWPQFYNLHASAAVPDAMLNRALVMTMLCSGMCYVGYQKGSRPIQKLHWAFDRDRLSKAAFVMTVIGLGFQYKLSQIPEAELGTQWSGTPVMLLFFSNLIIFGFALSVFLILRRYSFLALVTTILAVSGYVHTIVFAGRREPSIQFFLIIGTLTWFIRKKAPPRIAVAAVILAGAFISYNIGVYRGAMAQGGVFKGGANVSELKEMKEVTETGTEMRNAVFYITATQNLGAYDFGLVHWNSLVFAYFPAQIFGRDAKDFLMTLGGLLNIGNNAASAYGYESSTGTTFGGITDAFASFWYFGCLEFFVIGYFMRKFYEAAIRGSPVWQLCCALLTVYSLLAITHNTNHAVAPWVQATLFLTPALIYARVKRGERSREVISATLISHGVRGAQLPSRCASGMSRGVRKYLPKLPRFRKERKSVFGRVTLKGMIKSG